MPAFFRHKERVCEAFHQLHGNNRQAAYVKPHNKEEGKIQIRRQRSSLLFGGSNLFNDDLCLFFCIYPSSMPHKLSSKTMHLEAIKGAVMCSLSLPPQFTFLSPAPYSSLLHKFTTSNLEMKYFNAKNMDPLKPHFNCLFSICMCDHWLSFILRSQELSKIKIN